MTYLEFHVYFTLPATAIGLGAWLATSRWPITAREQSADPAESEAPSSVANLTVDTDGAGRPLVPASALALVAVLAFIYTLPWDHLLIRWGVWGYPPGRVAATIFGVPLEECAFFLIQPVLAGSWTVVLARIGGAALRAGPRIASGRAVSAWSPVGAAAGLAVTAAGAGLLLRTETLYLGMILAWSGPVLALQWGLAGRLLLRQLRLLILAVAAASIYLWIADRIAIGAEIWHISETYTTGFVPLGLPVEEAVFFLVTNVLVVQGLLMLSDPSAR